MAKMHAGRTAVEVTEEAVELLGGYGYLNEYEVERFYRDAKITEIYEGNQRDSEEYDRVVSDGKTQMIRCYPPCPLL